MPAVPIIGMGASLAGGLLNKKKGGQQTTTNQFDPAGMAAYQGLQGPGANVLQDYMKDPWTAGFFQNQMARTNESAGLRAQSALSNLYNAAGGVSGVSGGGVATGAMANPNAWLASQVGAIGRGTSREKAESLSNLLINAESLRRGAAGAALAYRPLQTGQTTTTPQGSMLGNILGMGGNALMSSPWGGGSKASPSASPTPYMSPFVF